MAEHPPTPESTDSAHAEGDDRLRVLIVRPSALGDVCRTVPAVASLRRALPDARIDWMVREAFADAVRHHTALDNVVIFPRARFGALWRSPTVLTEAVAWARRLARQRYDIVIDLQGLFRSGLFTRLTRSPQRIGFSNAREVAWLGYNRRYWIDPNVHTVDRMLGLLEAHGYPIEHDTRLYVGEEDQQWLDDRLGGGGEPAVPYTCLAPMARWQCKCWPLQRYIEIGRRLLADGIGGERLIVIAAPDERQYIEPLLDAFRDDDRVTCPTTTVGQMMAVVANSRLLVSNDSAPLHMAVGFDRPIVAIFGPTDPALAGPYRRLECVVQPEGIQPRDMRNYRHLRSDQRLISKVPVDAVWDRIVDQLGR